MKEIGGYLECEHHNGSLLHDGAVKLNSGRGCLSYLKELRNIKAIWLPDFMCNSVTEYLRSLQVNVIPYEVGIDFRPKNDIVVHEDEHFLLMDYYGQLDKAYIEDARTRFKDKLIIDRTHSYYSISYDNVDSFTSCRKWFGVPDGAFLITRDNDRIQHDLELDRSLERYKTVLGRYEDGATLHFADARANNDLFADQPAKCMSSLTENVLRGIDYDAVRTQRKKNFSYLHAHFHSSNILDLHLPEAPFMYPLYIDAIDAVVIRKKLAEQNIYIPTLWPNLLETNQRTTDAYYLARNILPLPVDQRYDTSDMRLIIKAIDSLIANDGE